MRLRILVNLVSFAVLGVVLCVWALTSIVTVDALRKPFTVRAEFASSPGLRQDLEVSYLGVRVGSVDTVKLEHGKVVVDMHMDRGVEVPSNVKAAVLRKSAVGEPYIEMEPGDGQAGRILRQGDVIPLSRTSVTVDYKQLFDGFGNLLKAVDPKDANTVLHELAVGLSGRDTTLRDLIGDAHQLTGTLADNAEVLDELSVQLTRLTEILADGGPELANGLDGLAAFSTELSGQRKNLDSVLDRGPQFLTNVRALMDAARPGLSCLLNALGTPSAPLFTPETSENLTHGLGLLHQRVPKIVNDVIEKTPHGSYAKVTMVLVAGGSIPAAKEYIPALTGPKTPNLYYCTKAYKTNDLQEKTRQTNQRAAEPAATPQAGPFTAVEAPETTSARPASDSSPLGRWLPLLPVVLAAAVLAFAARRAIAVLRRRTAR